MRDYLLDLKDGKVIDLYYDCSYESGCETCDYGSEYIQDYDFKLTNGTFNIHINQMYDYAFSEGDMMKIVLNYIDEIKEMTQKQFVEFMREKVLEVTDDAEFNGIYCEEGDK